MMLGNDRMAELRAIAKSHKLAAGSQRVPNSVAEIAVAKANLRQWVHPQLLLFQPPSARNYPSRRLRGKPPG